MAALVLATANELQSTEPGGELVVGYAPPLLHRRLRLELHGEAGPTVPANTVDGVSGSALAAGGGVRGCYGPAWGTVSVLGCAGVELDWMQVKAATTQAATWATVELGGQARWRVARRVALRLDLAALVPTVQPQFVVRSSPGDQILGTVSQPGPVWGRLGAGVEVLLF